MTNTITLGSPPAPKQPRSVEEMKPGQIVVWTESDGRRRAAVRGSKPEAVAMDNGSLFSSPAPFEGSSARVLLPGESITITVGE